MYSEYISLYTGIVILRVHIGIVSMMSARPLVVTDTFSGTEDKRLWTDWIFHFENIAPVNSWD